MPSGKYHYRHSASLEAGFGEQRLFNSDAIAIPLPSRIGGNFKPIAAELHAAPATGSFLAGVEEMKHTLSTLANSASVRLSEQLRGTVGQWRKQIFWLSDFEG